MTWRRRLRRWLNQRIGAAPVPRAAREMLAGKGLAVSDHWTDVWREEHATAFTAARMTGEAMVEEVHRELVEALQSGETMETFRARVQSMLERRGWAPPARGGDVPTRIARIYRTNMRTARAAGRWQRIARRADVMPYLVYLLGPSIEHRDAHVALEGHIVRVDDPFWNTHFPPNGWGCKCRTRQVTARERGRLLERAPQQYSTEAPAVSEVEWTNPATGELRRVAAGIDPGWDYNPGQHRTLGIHRHAAERDEAALAGRSLPGVAAPVREELVRERIQRSLAAPGFRWFIERPRPRRAPSEEFRREARDEHIEVAPVAVTVPEVLAAAEVSAGRLLYLPLFVADKQWYAHGLRGRQGATGRVPAGWYADVQAMVDDIEPYLQVMWVDDRGKRVSRQTPGAKKETRWVYDDRARGRRLVVKRDGAGRLIVVTYHPRTKFPKKKPRSRRRRGS